MIVFKQDKANHFLYGFFVFVIANIFLPGGYALLITFMIANLKEIYDLIYKKTYFDIMDLLFTCIPGITLVALSYL